MTTLKNHIRDIKLIWENMSYLEKGWIILMCGCILFSIYGVIIFLTTHQSLAQYGGWIK